MKRCALRPALLILFIWGSLTPSNGDLNAASAPNPAHVAETLPPRPGIRNLGRVSTDIYRGGQPSRRGFAALREMGVRTVISFGRRPDDSTALDSNGLAGVHIPLDPREPPTDTEAAFFLRILDDRARGPFFVHCYHGRDRTGVMIGLYRIRRQGWTSEEAIAEMRAYGHNPRAYPKLTNFLRN